MRWKLPDTNSESAKDREAFCRPPMPVLSGRGISVSRSYDARSFRAGFEPAGESLVPEITLPLDA
jgi:hypothetical protein